MNEQNCAARKALEEIAALRLNPYCRIVPSGAVAVEPVEVLMPYMLANDGRSFFDTYKPKLLAAPEVSHGR